MRSSISKIRKRNKKGREKWKEGEGERREEGKINIYREMGKKWGDEKPAINNVAKE